ncbi:MAG: hypothetical protein KDJ75_03745 [Alphaproteobacteria bacterium]|nr:hypothetical protein [Alphaproteobacteria bacterium]
MTTTKKFQPLETLWRRRGLVAGVFILAFLASLSISALPGPFYEARALFITARDNTVFMEDLRRANESMDMSALFDKFDLWNTPEYNTDIPDREFLVSGWFQRARKLAESDLSEQARKAHALRQLRGNIRLVFMPGGERAEIRVFSGRARQSSTMANHIQALLRAALSEKYTFVPYIEDLNKPGRVLYKEATISWTPVRPPFFGALCIAGIVLGLVAGIISAFFADYLYIKRRAYALSGE